MSSIYDQLGDACKQFGKRVGMAIKEANDLMATNGRREREMSKYVIELDEDVKILQSISVTQHGNAYTNTKWVANLEELNSDYINEHYGELQDEAYQRGLEDAWNVARKLAVGTDDGGVSISDLYKIFGAESMCTIMKNNTVYNAIAKLKAYEENKDDPIKVGDEVTHKSDSVLWKGVCIQIDDDRRHMNLMGYTGAVGYYPVDDFKKTGRHFDIEGILKEIRK